MGLTPPTPVIGIDAEGHWPLPWLQQPFEGAQALRQAHALLLHGPAGAGHLELAGLLVQAGLCEAPPQPGRPCGQCAACHLVRQRAHPDLLLLLPDALRAQFGWTAEDEGRPAKSDAKPSRELKVGQVREAIAWGQQTDSRGRGKYLVLHPADSLNPAAANALLKTLEEPPGRLRLLLTSADPERLLPTVRSRCQRVQLSLPSPAQAASWLRAQGLADPEALLALASGSTLEALALAAEGLTPEWLGRLPRLVAAGDASALLGRPVPRVVELLLKLVHDALVQANGGRPRFYAAASLPAGADPAALVAWQKALLRVARHDEHPWNAGLLIESLVTQAGQAWHLPRPPGPARSLREAKLAP